MLIFKVSCQTLFFPYKKRFFFFYEHRKDATTQDSSKIKIPVSLSCHVNVKVIVSKVMFFIWKCIKIIFFLFFKFIFDIRTSKQFKNIKNIILNK